MYIGTHILFLQDNIRNNKAIRNKSDIIQKT